MKKTLLAVALFGMFGLAQAASVVVGGAGSVSGAASNATTGVLGNGASVQGTTNQTQGTASVLVSAGAGNVGPVNVGGANVVTNAGTTSTGLSVGATSGHGFGFTGGTAGSQSGAAGFGGFIH